MVVELFASPVTRVHFRYVLLKYQQQCWYQQQSGLYCFFIGAAAAIGVGVVGAHFYFMDNKTNLFAIWCHFKLKLFKSFSLSFLTSSSLLSSLLLLLLLLLLLFSLNDQFKTLSCFYRDMDFSAQRFILKRFQLMNQKK